MLHTILLATLFTPGAMPLAMMTTAQLDVIDLDGGVVSHGNGHYTSTFQGSGTIANGIVVESTTVALTCAVDANAETLNCTGSLKVADVSAPIRLRWEAGEVRYSIRSGYSAKHIAAWELWMTEELVDLLPPDGTDDGGGDDGGGGGGGGNLPGGDVFVGEVWTTADWWSDDWTLILDGAVVSGLWW